MTMKDVASYFSQNGATRDCNETFKLDILKAFVFTIEHYLDLTSLDNVHQYVMRLAILIKGNALAWLCASCNFRDIGYSDSKENILLHLIPTHHEQEARDAFLR